jgi:hypothetical protein
MEKTKIIVNTAINLSSSEIFILVCPDLIVLVVYSECACNFFYGLLKIAGGTTQRQ